MSTALIEYIHVWHVRVLGPTAVSLTWVVARYAAYT